ncbi:hypothetical protein HDR59_04035 [bacterium]|nr:hypothetical protein [bacterium]
MNLNKEEIKYLTKKDIEKKYKKELSNTLSTSYSYAELKCQYSVDEINNLNNRSFDLMMEELLYLPYDDLKFLSDYINLFEPNHPNRYDLLKKLMDIYEKNIVRHSSPIEQNNQVKEINQSEKIAVLKKSFDIFKRLKNRDRILNSMFVIEKTEIDKSSYRAPMIKFAVSDILLNEKSFFYFLLSEYYYEEYESKYNEILKNFFPNTNNNQR